MRSIYAFEKVEWISSKKKEKKKETSARIAHYAVSHRTIFKLLPFDAEERSSEFISEKVSLVECLEFVSPTRARHV